jgi:glycosyltransferase involved in cell wall biosynthesis
MQNSNQPFFSIVTACRDQLEFVKITADALLAQTFENWEWLFVDDGSHEDLAAFFSTLNDPRVQYYRNPTNIGQTRSLNFAITKSRASWIVRVDGDDIPSIHRLQDTFLTIHSHSHARLLFGHYDVIEEQGEPLTKIRYNVPGKKFVNYLRNKNNPICHPTVTFFKFDTKNEIFLYDEKLRNAQDYELWRRHLTEYPQGLCLVDSTLVAYRIVRGALSGARIKEQTRELNDIRNRSMILKDSNLVVTANIPPSSQLGMYCYRKTYYRFIGAEGVSLFGIYRQWLDAFSSLRYMAVAPKAAFVVFWDL